MNYESERKRLEKKRDAVEARKTDKIKPLDQELAYIDAALAALPKMEDDDA